MIDAVATYGLSAANTPRQNKDALHSAINDAQGATVAVAEGLYPIEPITITKPGTHLLFSPGAYLQVPPDSRSPAILNIAADNVTIDGGQFDGGSITGNAGVMAIRIYGSCSHIAIRNCTIRNASTGIGSYNASSCGDWLIENNTIETTVRSHGIYLHGAPKLTTGVVGVRVMGNIIIGAKGNGIWAGNGFSVVSIINNIIANSGRMGIEVWRNPDGRFLIAENFVSTCASFGISIAGTPHTICHGNVVTDATSYGIEVAGSRFVTLANNHIEGVKAREGGTKPTGITLNSPTNDALGDIAISGGIITGCTTGINVCGDKGKRGNIAITGIVIRDCVYGIRNVGHVGKADGGGIVEHIAITGCAIHVGKVGIGNSMYGGVMRGGVVSGNNIHVTDGDGIDLFRAAEMAIMGNRIVGADVPGSVGIRLRDHDKGELRSHDLLVGDNLIVHFEAAHVYNPRIAQEMAA